MTGRRLHDRIAVAAALLALLLRLLLPALHDERAHRASTAAPTAVCSCGHHHAPARDHGAPTRCERDDRVDREPHTCLACQVQASTPGNAPDHAPTLAFHGTCRRLHILAATADGFAATTELPPSRAPPRRT